MMTVLSGPVNADLQGEDCQMKLAEMRRSKAELLSSRAIVAVLPIGAVEQHSRHLPLGTDAMVATAVAERLEAAITDDVVLMPTLWYGASGHHTGFSGTVSVGTDPLVATATAAVRSLAATSGVHRFLILNGHGGNQPAVRVIVERLRDELPEATVWGLDYWDAAFAELEAQGQARPTGMGHADHSETSLVLAVRPDLVELSTMAADGFRDGLPAWVHTTAGFRDRTAHGGVGDPAGASAESGNQLLDAAITRLQALVRTLQDT